MWNRKIKFQNPAELRLQYNRRRPPHTEMMSYYEGTPSQSTTVKFSVKTACLAIFLARHVGALWNVFLFCFCYPNTVTSESDTQNKVLPVQNRKYGEVANLKYESLTLKVELIIRKVVLLPGRCEPHRFRWEERRFFGFMVGTC